MKILFLNPSRDGSADIPLNLPILISLLKNNNHEVRLFDLADYLVFEDKANERIFFKEAKFDPEKVRNDRKAHYKDAYGDVVTGSELKHSDYRDDFATTLVDFKPDMIAVSCLSVDFRFTCDFLSGFKHRYQIPTIFGGIHAILMPEETLASPICDYVCVGEGEESFIELLYALENSKSLEGVRGIWYKKEGAIVKNAPAPLTDMATLPPADFTCFDPIHFYRPFDGNRYKMVNYELSRGCPFGCSYCVNSVLKEKYKGLGHYHRMKQVNQSIGELTFLIDKYDFDFVRFWDEDFTAISVSRLEEYSRAYSREIHLPFLIYARVNSVTEKKVRILKDMGCKTFAMGIESGNESIRARVMYRHVSNDAIIETFRLVKSVGIRASAYNIIGLPCETRKEIFDTIELNRMVKPDSFSVTYLEPYKGVPIRKMCEDEGLDPSYEVTEWDPLRPKFVPKGMSYDELRGLFRTFPFYVRFPKDRYNEIEHAEREDTVYEQLLAEFAQIR